MEVDHNEIVQSDLEVGYSYLTLDGVDALFKERREVACSNPCLIERNSLENYRDDITSGTSNAKESLGR